MKRFISVFSLCLLALTACKKDPTLIQNTHCITHRGLVFRDDGTERVENSMETFRAAFAAGADGTEFDIRHTSDGIAMIQHDHTLRKASQSKAGKTCALDAEVSDLTYAQIHDNCELKNGEEVPTFEQVLAEFSGKTVRGVDFTLLFDMKDTPNDRTIDLIKKYYVGHYDAVISMVSFITNLKSLYSLRSKMPNLLYVSGDHYVAGMDNGFDGIEMRTVSDINARMLVNKGKQFAIYDIETPAEFKRFFELGATYLTTDALKACLSQKGIL